MTKISMESRIDPVRVAKGLSIMLPRQCVSLMTCEILNCPLTTSSSVSKPCGHVICKPCVEKFVTPKDDPHGRTSKSLRCYVCDIDLSGKKGGHKRSGDKDRIRPGLVLIESDGTGFTAGGGIVTAEKQGVAFQC